MFLYIDNFRIFAFEQQQKQIGKENLFPKLPYLNQTIMQMGGETWKVGQECYPKYSGTPGRSGAVAQLEECFACRKDPSSVLRTTQTRHGGACL